MFLFHMNLLRANEGSPHLAQLPRRPRHEYPVRGDEPGGVDGGVLRRACAEGLPRRQGAQVPERRPGAAAAHQPVARQGHGPDPPGKKKEWEIDVCIQNQ